MASWGLLQGGVVAGQGGWGGLFVFIALSRQCDREEEGGVPGWLAPHVLRQTERQRGSIGPSYKEKDRPGALAVSLIGLR